MPGPGTFSDAQDVVDRIGRVGPEECGTHF